MTELVQTHVHQTVAAPTEQFTRERIDTWKRTYCKGASDVEAMQFIETCKRTNLSPESRHIYLVPRWDSRERRNTFTPQVSIDGLRLIAQRTGVYGGQIGPFWCGDDGKWIDVWLRKDPPLASKVGVIRKDWKEPLYAIATWDSYCQTTKDGRPTAMWQKMASLMLSKCAEALALRKAFPGEMGGLYTSDEMAQSTNSSQLSQVTTTPARIQAQPISVDPIVRAEKMLQKFSKFNIDRYYLEDLVGSKDIEEFTEDDFKHLGKIYRDLETGKITEADLNPYKDEEVKGTMPPPEPDQTDAVSVEEMFEKAGDCIGNDY